MSLLSRFAVAFALFLVASRAFYIPGISPTGHAENEEVGIMVNSLRSLSAIVPYSYYTLPFCPPQDGVRKKQESIGELLWGDDVETSPYVVTMKRNESCVLLKCPAGTDVLTDAQIAKLDKFIRQGYRGRMSIDNLPSFNPGVPILNLECRGTLPKEQQYPYLRGYALGVGPECVGQTLLNNHLAFTIKYNSNPDAPDGKIYMIVGFTVVPYSIKHDPSGLDCNPVFDVKKVAGRQAALRLSDLTNGSRPFWSYSVTWIEDNTIAWGSRWDEYLHTSVADSNQQVHWMYIINSLLISLCLSTIAAMILLRTLHKDFNRYNSADPDEQQEEMGWKLVHADVFRPPRHCGFLSILVGTGLQLTLMFTAALFFSLLGFLSPANRGGLLTTLLLLFVLLSFVAGYMCARLLKLFDARQWKTIFLCSIFFPGSVFALFFLIDLILWRAKASNAVPFGTLATLFGLFGGISIPLCVLGASFGFRQGRIEVPTKVGALAREIPLQRWYLSPPFTYIVPGLIPFGSAFLELRFIFSSIWQGMVYYVFGFLALVFLIWIVIICLTTIITVYYQLCYEDYRWWWRSLIVPGGLGLHFYAYAVYYYYSEIRLEAGLGTFLYFAYMAIAALAYGFTSGFIGFVSSFIFVRKIYGAIKID